MAADTPHTLDELLSDPATGLRLGPADAARLLGDVAEYLGRLWQLHSVLVVAAVGRSGAPPEADSLLTMEQVAGRLGVPVPYARELGRRGELPTVRVGSKYVRVRESSLTAWLRQREEVGHVPARAYHPRPKGTEPMRAPVVPLRSHGSSR